jgi:hemerythrin-like metal-binding protein
MLDEVDLYYQTQGGPIMEILDRQHSEIKQKRQNLRTSIINGMGFDQIAACAMDLIATTLEHFKSEESAMEAGKFQGLGVQRLLHAHMIESVKTIWTDLEHRKINDALELLKFFDMTLTYHLESEDGAFGRESRI